MSEEEEFKKELGIHKFDHFQLTKEWIDLLKKEYPGISIIGRFNQIEVVYKNYLYIIRESLTNEAVIRILKKLDALNLPDLIYEV